MAPDRSTRAVLIFTDDAVTTEHPVQRLARQNGEHDRLITFDLFFNDGQYALNPLYHLLVAACSAATPLESEALLAVAHRMAMQTLSLLCGGPDSLRLQPDSRRLLDAAAWLVLHTSSVDTGDVPTVAKMMQAVMVPAERQARLARYPFDGDDTCIFWQQLDLGAIDTTALYSCVRRYESLVGNWLIRALVGQELPSISWSTWLGQADVVLVYLSEIVCGTPHSQLLEQVIRQSVEAEGHPVAAPIIG